MTMIQIPPPNQKRIFAIRDILVTDLSTAIQQIRQDGVNQETLASIRLRRELLTEIVKYMELIGLSSNDGNQTGQGVAL